MEYTLSDFTEKIRTYMYNLFPYMEDELNLKVHRKRPRHIRDIAFMENPVTYGENTQIFEIGNPIAERDYPYYHILQDAEVIHKRGRGTEKSKGSQALISKAEDRDYGRVNWNGKIFTQEYKKNVRGQRSRADKATRYIVDTDGVVYKINANADYYYNKHYRYIDKILDATLPTIADTFGMKMMRKQDTGLEEEYNEQQDIAFDNLLNALYSMEE